MPKSSKSHPAFTASLNKVFEALDACPTDGFKPFFPKLADKEYYETQVMFSVRKREAAAYHLVNVRRHLANDLKASQRAALKHAPNTKPSKGAFSVSLSISKGEYVHELGAFLGALRSGLDFASVFASRSISGVSAHSITTLVKMVDEGKVAPMLEVVKAHRDWILALRAYRDETVHRLVVASPASGWRVSHDGLTSTVSLPIVVPKSIPERVSDTRRSRSMDADVPLGLNEFRKHAVATFPDGTIQALDHSVTYSPANGYIAIDEFMRRHLESYDAFLNDIFGTLSTLDFHPPSKPTKLSTSASL
ncbi:hypothetical protein [Rhizobium sp. P44RR-XXIV]|uniref:hypothetical protein n=1 Tax=Rhizobium sp. P44RR-XXIV TaxID=1921145 RepID=UPI0009848A72|nr:hypothetical protein [Rhizobium sp. P44RR-XXIV]TIX93467.1 hypothetical protein BSK43_000755 [Rhizobium sp. P44RR-XXIV]